MGGCLHTFLALVENGGTGVVDAFLGVVLVRLLAAFVDALFRHGCVLLVGNAALAGEGGRAGDLKAGKGACELGVVLVLAAWNILEVVERGWRYVIGSSAGRNRSWTRGR